jgi:phenylpropionate dioxygenase-like ring-hydroxylating dioxygenase large terminal subunit
VLVTKEPALRRFWYPLTDVDAVPHGVPLGRRLLGVDVVLYRSGDDVVAAIDRCPHRDAALSGGWMADGRVVCPYHGWEFALSGRCERIPQADDDATIPPRARLEMLPCTTRYGWVWVSLDPEPVGGIPDLPEFDQEGWRVVPEFDTLWHCSAAHLIENNFDPAHIAFVHKGSFGAVPDARIPVPEVTRTAYGVRSQVRVPVAARPGETTATERRTTSEMHAPFLGVFRIGYPDGLMHIMVKACTPVDDGVTRLLQFVVRNDTDADRPPADIVAFDSQVAVEDKAVLERISPDFPLDLTRNVHVRFDRASLELRRLWSDLVAGEWLPGSQGAAA